MTKTILEDHILGLSVIYADEMTQELRSRIELFPEGTYVHPKAGKMEITADELSAFAADVNARGDRIPLDFDHSFGMGKGSLSAGWFVKGTAVLDASSQDPSKQSLYADVQWTPRAAQSIKDGEYRFISPEWNTNWRDKATGTMRKGARLFAAALTNRPFFDNMAAINLCDEGIESMLSNEDPTDGREAKKEETMTKAIAEALGLKADATEDEITAALKTTADEAARAASLDTQIAELTAKTPTAEIMETLVANAAAGAEAAKELETVKMNTLLDAAIRDRKIDPAQREMYASLYAANSESVEKLFAATAAGSWESRGSEGENDGRQMVAASSAGSDSLYGANPPSMVTIDGNPTDVDETSSEIHKAALEVLDSAGKGMTYTADEYADAAIHAAAKKGIVL